MRIFRRKAAGPQLCERVTDPMETAVAVGALAGIAPVDVHAHMLLTVDSIGEMRVAGRGCAYLSALMSATAFAQIVARIPADGSQLPMLLALTANSAQSLAFKAYESHQCEGAS